MKEAIPQCIAILYHEEQKGRQDLYLIEVIAEIWRQRGCRVVSLYGTKERVEADLLVVHVDRSVVDPAYLEFAALYPRTINLGAADIRKHRYCDWLVRPGDGYTGPVIVKTDLNYAGRPERRERGVVRRAFEKGWRLLEGAFPRVTPPAEITGKEQYRIYASVAEVPAGRFEDERMVVQRFLPERSGKKYVLREAYFLGDAHGLRAETSDHPVITNGEYAPGLVQTEIPTEILAMRAEMKLDYGKIDYVMRDGKAVIFDCNKTMGTSASEGGWRAAQAIAWGVCAEWRKA
jgi:hypothetical protein